LIIIKTIENYGRLAIMNDKYTNRIEDQAGIENLVKFDSFYRNKYLDPFIAGYAFVFVTKPSLFIYPIEQANPQKYENLAYENMVRDPKFTQFTKKDKFNNLDTLIAEQLSYVRDGNNNNIKNFLPLFTNRTKSFSALDVVMNQQEAFDTKQGYRMVLPTFKTESEGSGSASLAMQETSNLDIIKTLTLWVNYISNITDGTFHANPDMVKNGVLDYMSSIYYFVLEPDGKTLKYWAKYTGCWPNTIPYAALSYNRGDQSLVDLEVNFLYMTKEDMNPMILEDFNRVSLDSFIDQNAGSNQDYSILSSDYLTKSLLKTNPNYINNKDSRDPLVFMNEANGTKKFELTFGINSYRDNFESNKFDENYFQNPEDLFNSDLDKD
jgi:hypothetical protein